MPVPRRLRAVCAAPLALALLAGRPAHAEPAPAPAEGAESAPTPEPVSGDMSQTDADTVLDVVLPCGLRVLAARDISLPVAAVVLAVEVGSEDDPPEHPGLVHALAYHLHQGNRELRPGETIAAAQDAGGVHLLSTGPGQVRFESLVPVSRLDEVLFAESQRLRFPTLDRRRWEISLGWAASDVRDPPRLRPKDLVALFGAPGLGHDGRVVDRSLAGMNPAALASQLASKFHYARATLVVVAPDAPAAIVEQVRARFADLPPATRVVPTRSPSPARPPLGPAAAPADPPAAPAAPAATGKPPLLAWPIPPDPVSAGWAIATCRALNRQKRDTDEPRKARIACDFAPDPRRPVLVVRPLGSDDPIAFVRQRLARLTAADHPLLLTQAQFVAQAVRLYTRTPLGLARQLSATAAAPAQPVPTDRPAARRRADLTGLTSLAGMQPFTLAVEDALVIGPAEVRP